MPDGRAAEALRGCSLLLVGHGSHLSGASAAPVYAVAERLRAGGEFVQVAEAFWKEEPSLAEALDLVAGERVVVVPLFLAEGYFTRVVVPRELAARARPHRPVALARPVGTHPRMEEAVLRRARGALRPGEEAASALLVVGHGTERSPTSGGTLDRLAAGIAARGLFREVRRAFLDQEPRPERAVAGLAPGPVVVVPFFVAEGWHAGTTLPDDLGAAEGGPALRCTPPVGTLPEVAGMARELALEAAALLGPPAARGPRRPLPTGPGEAHRALHGWVAAAGGAGRAFLQLHLRPLGGGAAELRHLEDAGVAREGLRTLATPAEARALARRTAAGAHRPLRAAPDLPRGWRLPVADARALGAALEAVYPGAALAWHRGRSGDPGAVPFARTAARQTGHHAGVAALSGARLEAAVADFCLRGCLRRPAWHPGAPAAAGGADVPCVEACSPFLAFARGRVDGDAPPAPHRTPTP